ncbi:MAG: hypothetical protein IAE97_01040 [Chthoniobacterales bacterium]|nr:hypothetical protein [Chthoniobacterales bacterium]
MALLRLIFGLLLLGWAGVHAEDPPSVPEPVEIRFVPPGVQGTVSLGIFDASGRLVRTLCDEWTFNRFRIGLNGLSTDWDGQDDAGRPVPPGTYEARGFIVGDVSVAGSAFYFNDWIETEDSPRIVRVAAQELLPGGDILLAARLAGGTGALVRYSPQSEARWRTMVSEPRPEQATGAQLAVSDTMAFVVLDGILRAANLEDGAEVPLTVAAKPVKAVAARGDRLAICDEDGVRIFKLPEFSPMDGPKTVPADVVSLALLDQGEVAAAQDGSAWQWSGGDWSRLDLPDRVRSVAGGHAGTFWVLEEREDGSHCVAQYSMEEGRLAEWVPKADKGSPAGGLSVADNQDYFALTLATPEVQRTVAIRRNGATAGWEFVVDKRITRSTDFGWKDGELVPAGGEQPEDLEVKLTGNPLDPSASGVLALRTTAGATGSGLATADGLPLLRVSESDAFQRVMVIGGADGHTARFFQGDGACVEEYEITNLGDITSFDAGEIVMASSGEAEPPPAVEPEAEQ